MVNTTLKKIRDVRVNIGIANISIFDTVGSLGIGYLIARKLNKPWYYSFSVIPVGVIVHKIAGVKTPLNDALDKAIDKK